MLRLWQETHRGFLDRFVGCFLGSVSVRFVGELLSIKDLGAPHLGHEIACSEIVLWHSRHWISTMVSVPSRYGNLIGLVVGVFLVGKS